VLVTGGSGFIGRHTLSALQRRGFDVHVVGRNRGPAVDHITCHQADLLDPSHAAAVLDRVRPTDVLHLAWYAVPTSFWHAPENALWAAASVALFDAAIAAGVERIVAAGSCAEYDWTDGVCDETRTPIAPTTPYGRAKADACRALFDRARSLARGAAWGRVFFVYGPGEHPSRLVAGIIRAVLRGEPAPCTTGEQLRDFLFVGDVGSGLAALLDSEVTGAVNISSGTAVAVRDVAEAAAAAAGGRDRLALGAIPVRSGEPPMILGLPGRLVHDAGWRPETPLATGLARSVEFWRLLDRLRT
jgi:nucleoside-diphosphate-sugar epimerase